MGETWTSLRLIDWTAGHFEKNGIPNPRLDAELLLAHVLKCQRIDLYTRHDIPVPEKQRLGFKELIGRRLRREPLQYILGEAEFWGLKLKVTPAVLIPRPETELLVEQSLSILASASPRILEIGTGSGCIAIALAKELPGAKIIATDLSKEALEVARENATRNDVVNRIEFILADVAPWRRFETEGLQFDLIVSNPPYIRTEEFPSLQPEVRDFEPRQALDGGSDGLSMIGRILEEAPPFLKTTGKLIFEIGESEAGPVAALVPPLEITKVLKDLAGHDRVVELAFQPLIL